MKWIKLFESFGGNEIVEVEYYKLISKVVEFDPYDIKQIQTYNPNFKIHEREGTKNLPLSLKTSGDITYIFIRQLSDKSFLIETLGKVSKFYHCIDMENLYQELKSLNLVKI